MRVTSRARRSWTPCVPFGTRHMTNAMSKGLRRGRRRGRSLLLDVIQWTGAAFIVVGYFYFGKANVLRGAVLSGTGCVLFVWWSLATAAWAIAALNAVILLSILTALWRIWKEGARGR